MLLYRCCRWGSAFDPSVEQQCDLRLLLYSLVSSVPGVRRRGDEAGQMESGSRRQIDSDCRSAVTVVVVADMIWQWCLGDG